MNLFTTKRVTTAALIGLALTAAVSHARADIANFTFEPVQSDVKQGDGTIIAVRLIDKKSGKTVPDAVIFATRIDMAPDGMEVMTAPIEQLPSTEPGIYRFRANLTMEGGWQLSLAAKIQGETGTLENKLVLKALP